MSASAPVRLGQGAAAGVAAEAVQDPAAAGQAALRRQQPRAPAEAAAVVGAARDRRVRGGGEETPRARDAGTKTKALHRLFKKEVILRVRFLNAVFFCYTCNNI